MSLLSAKNSKGACSHPQSLALLNNTQCACLKSFFLDTEVLLLNLTECSNLFDAEATPDCRLLDSFPNHIFFYFCNYSSLNDCTAHLESLNYFYHKVVSSPSTLVIVTSTSVIPSKNM